MAAYPGDVLIATRDHACRDVWVVPLPVAVSTHLITWAGRAGLPLTVPSTVPPGVLGSGLTSVFNTHGHASITGPIQSQSARTTTLVVPPGLQRTTYTVSLQYYDPLVGTTVTGPAVARATVTNPLLVTRLKPQTHILTNADEHSLRVAPGHPLDNRTQRLVLSFSSPSPHLASSLHPGGILVVPPGPDAPAGLLRRVVAVTRLPGGRVSVSTIPAAITDALAQGEYNVTLPFTPQSFGNEAAGLTPHGVAPHIGPRNARAGASTHGEGVSCAGVPLAIDMALGGSVTKGDYTKFFAESPDPTLNGKEYAEPETPESKHQRNSSGNLAMDFKASLCLVGSANAHLAITGNSVSTSLSVHLAQTASLNVSMGGEGSIGESFLLFSHTFARIVEPEPIPSTVDLILKMELEMDATGHLKRIVGFGFTAGMAEDSSVGCSVNYHFAFIFPVIDSSGCSGNPLSITPSFKGDPPKFAFEGTVDGTLKTSFAAAIDFGVMTPNIGFSAGVAVGTKQDKKALNQTPLFTLGGQGAPLLYIYGEPGINEGINFDLLAILPDFLRNFFAKNALQWSLSGGPNLPSVWLVLFNGLSPSPTATVAPVAPTNTNAPATATSPPATKETSMLPDTPTPNAAPISTLAPNAPTSTLAPNAPTNTPAPNAPTNTPAPNAVPTSTPTLAASVTATPTDTPTSTGTLTATATEVGTSEPTPTPISVVAGQAITITWPNDGQVIESGYWDGPDGNIYDELSGTGLNGYRCAYYVTNGSPLSKQCFIPTSATLGLHTISTNQYSDSSGDSVGSVGFLQVFVIPSGSGTPAARSEAPVRSMLTPTADADPSIRRWATAPTVVGRDGGILGPGAAQGRLLPGAG